MKDVSEQKMRSNIFKSISFIEEYKRLLGKHPRLYDQDVEERVLLNMFYRDFTQKVYEDITLRVKIRYNILKSISIIDDFKRLLEKHPKLDDKDSEERVLLNMLYNDFTQKVFEDFNINNFT